MAMVITTVSLPAGEVGKAYSVTLAQTGGTAPIAWTQTVGTLPTGLSLDGATGIISGTPTATVSAEAVTFHAVDSTPVTPQTADSSGLTLTVDAALVITTTSLPSAVIGLPYSATLAATGGVAPLTWTITAGALATGLSLNASTGAITGTPTAVGTPTVTFEVTDSLTPTPATASATFGTAVALGVAPTGNATPKANVSATFPLMPQCWPLTVIPGSDSVSAQVPPLQVPQQPDATNTEQNDVIDTALTQAGETGARLL